MKWAFNTFTLFLEGELSLPAAGFHCDDNGVCGMSSQQQADNIMCDGAAANYEIELIVADEDGNRSDPESMIGEQRGC